MNYSKQDIRQGLDLKRKAQETPSSFGTVEGATERPTGGFLKQRMAGEGGARALRMINDPKRTSTYSRLDAKVWIIKSRLRVQSS